MANEDTNANEQWSADVRTRLDKHGLTLADVARHLGVSRERARQLLLSPMYRERVEEAVEWCLANLPPNHTRIYAGRIINGCKAIEAQGIGNTVNRRYAWLFECLTCGKRFLRVNDRLKAHCPECSAYVTEDIAGARYGAWTVLGLTSTRPSATWLCRCDCGNEAIVTQANLKRGQSRGCKACGKTKGRERAKRPVLVQFYRKPEEGVEG